MNDDAANDKTVAEKGWGPTLRLSTLVLVRGLAHWLSAAREGRRGDKVVGATLSMVCVAVGMYAKAHGWV